MSIARAQPRRPQPTTKDEPENNSTIRERIPAAPPRLPPSQSVITLAQTPDEL